MKNSFFEFERPLIKGKITKRYKRFLADVILPDGTQVVAHVPNSGSMKTCWEKDAEVLLTDYSNREDRKLKFTLQAVKMPDGWVGVNTQNPNKAVEQAILAGKIPRLTGYDSLQSEVKINSKSRLDIVVWNSGTEESFKEIFSPNKKRLKPITSVKSPTQDYSKACFIEIKNVTLLEEGGATFPDAVTTRGQKHLEELINLKKLGHRAMILFFVERNSSQWMAPADEIDPRYGKLLRKALKLGVEALPLKVEVKESGLEIIGEIPIRL